MGSSYFSKGNANRRKIETIIPSVLKKVYPEINYEAYVKLKKSKTLVKETIPVCEECFLYHTRLNNFSGTKTMGRLLQAIGRVDYKGTGRLRPEVVRLRLEDTNAKIQRFQKDNSNNNSNLRNREEENQIKELYELDISNNNNSLISSFGDDDVDSVF